MPNLLTVALAAECLADAGGDVVLVARGLAVPPAVRDWITEQTGITRNVVVLVLVPKNQP